MFEIEPRPVEMRDCLACVPNLSSRDEGNCLVDGRLDEFVLLVYLPENDLKVALVSEATEDPGDFKGERLIQKYFSPPPTAPAASAAQVPEALRCIGT